jgi:hypothetical protein
MDDNLVHAAWNWRRRLQIATASGSRVFTLRYEDLVRAPEATVAEVLDFLGVAADDRTPDRSVADFYRRKIPESHRYLHPRLTAPISAADVDAWRSELTPHEVLLYERKNARCLLGHGYPLLQHGSRQPLAVRLRARTRYLADVARWSIRSASTAIRYAPAPRLLAMKIRNKYGERKARRSAHAPEQ